MNDDKPLPGPHYPPSEPPNPHDIGWAVRQMREGKRVCRHGRGRFGIYIDGGYIVEDIGDGRAQRRMFTSQDLLATDWELVP